MELHERRRHAWDLRFLELAALVASWSKDPSTKLGAVVVGEHNIVHGLGYNGFPRGVRDLDERFENRDLKLRLVVHAEVNAILNATRSVRGCRLYVYPTLMMPNICPECAKVAAQAGITEVVAFDDPVTTRWQELAEASKIILDETGIAMRAVSRR